MMRPFHVVVLAANGVVEVDQEIDARIDAVDADDRRPKVARARLELRGRR
jgi:hypothetical protein